MIGAGDWVQFPRDLDNRSIVKLVVRSYVKLVVLILVVKLFFFLGSTGDFCKFGD